jgi:lipoprotein-anchoring transpeptidase ErfK/SrfK
MRPTRSLAAALAALAVTAAPAAAQAPPAAPVAPDQAPAADDGRRVLSDERTITRWAHANQRVLARRAPRRSAPSVARLRYQTEDGYPEVYLALEQRRDAAGRDWVRVRLPMRPNGRTGWVPREALGSFRVVRTALRVNRGTLRATLYRRGRVVWRSPIGVGAPGTPTPRGRFYIRERLPGFGGVYGPVAFGTSAYSRLSDWPGGGVIGIHGTNQPGLIPGRPSHGCVRVPNRAILRLRRLMPVGTPVRIL